MSSNHIHDIRALIKQAQSSGFDVSFTSKNHLKFTSPAGDVVFGSSTPKDHRSVLNMRSRLRKVGLNDRK